MACYIVNALVLLATVVLVVSGGRAMSLGPATTPPVWGGDQRCHRSAPVVMQTALLAECKPSPLQPDSKELLANVTT